MHAANATQVLMSKRNKSRVSQVLIAMTAVESCTVFLNMTYLIGNFIESEKLDLTGAMKDSDCCHQFLFVMQMFLTYFLSELHICVSTDFDCNNDEVSDSNSQRSCL
jgi:hypothetical protein